MTMLLQRYELRHPLGSGGMAHVVAAIDQRLNRPVAIKLIRDELITDDTARARLLHEARTAATFQHPHVVSVFDVGEDASHRPFIVMELVDGPDLGARLVRDGTLGPANAAAVGVAVLDALTAAHRQGLVHRDLKPENVLLPAEGGVKLTDFGIAKGLESSAAGLTITGHIVGTPAYLSPEQTDGKPATPRSDLYAVGVMLYECLAGSAPFTGESAVAVAAAHQRDPVPPLIERSPHCPPRLVTAVERALAKDPQDRFADAEEMRREVADAAGLDAAPTISVPRGTLTAPAGVVDEATEVPTGTVESTDPVMELARADRPATTNRRQRRATRGAVTVGILAGLVGLLVFGGGSVDELAGDDGPPGSNPETDGSGGASLVADGPSPTPRSRPTASPGPTETTADRFERVGSVGDLAAALARDPAAVGQRGHDLLKAVTEMPGRDVKAVEIRKLLMEVSAWIHDGELDPDVGRAAIDVLESEARPQQDRLAAVSRLIAEVAADRDGWGEKSQELLEGLSKLLEEGDPDELADEAADLLAKVTKRADEGELDARRVERVIAVLRPLVDEAGDDVPPRRSDAHSGPPRGRPPGRARGH